MKKKLLLVLVLCGALAAWYLYRRDAVPPGTPLLEVLLPPMPAPQAPAPRPGSSGDGEEEGEEVIPFSSALSDLAGQVLGPLDAGFDEGALAEWTARARMEANARGERAAAAYAAHRLCRHLDFLADKRSEAIRNLRQMENRSFKSLNDDSADTAEKKAFFVAQAKRQWLDYAAEMRPSVNRMLRDVRANE